MTTLEVLRLTDRRDSMAAPTGRSAPPGRVAVLTRLLENHAFLVETLNSSDGVPGDGGSVVQMPLYTSSVRELERLMRVMRDSHHAPLVETPLGRVSLRRLWWHANEYWIRAQVTLVAPPRMPRSKRRQLQRAPLTDDGRPLPVRRVLRHPDCCGRNGEPGPLALAAVEWLAANWSLASEPMLPNELLAA